MHALLCSLKQRIECSGKHQNLHVVFCTHGSSRQKRNSLSHPMHASQPTIVCSIVSCRFPLVGASAGQPRRCTTAEHHTAPPRTCLSTGSSITGQGHAGAPPDPSPGLPAKGELAGVPASRACNTWIASTAARRRRILVEKDVKDHLVVSHDNGLGRWLLPSPPH